MRFSYFYRCTHGVFIILYIGVDCAHTPVVLVLCGLRENRHLGFCCLVYWKNGRSNERNRKSFPQSSRIQGKSESSSWWNCKCVWVDRRSNVPRRRSGVRVCVWACVPMSIDPWPVWVFILSHRANNQIDEKSQVKPTVVRRPPSTITVTVWPIAFIEGDCLFDDAIFHFYYISAENHNQIMDTTL